MMYRVGIENNKIKTNPARLLKYKREENRRVRFLNQNTEDEYERLRSVIEGRLACHLPEFHIALYTGMRPSEQYALTWERVDLVRQSLFLPKTKSGNARHIPLGDEALEAFTSLFLRSSGKGRVFVNIHGEPLRGYKHWFGPAVKAAGIPHFTWYCLRLTFASWLVMREHCYHGYQMVKKIPFLSEAAEIVYAHQERFDGTDYPRGLKGKEILLGARIVAVTNTLDSITSDLPYRPAQSLQAAREEIAKWSGRQFDPEIVKTFLEMPDNTWEGLRRQIEAQIFRVSVPPTPHGQA